MLAAAGFALVEPPRPSDGAGLAWLCRRRPHAPARKDNDISGVSVWVGRPKQVSRVIDALLEDAELGSHIQRARIGVVGHSNGGYTALAVAGAKPSPAASVAHCRQHPDDSKFCS